MIPASLRGSRAKRGRTRGQFGMEKLSEVRARHPQISHLLVCQHRSGFTCEQLPITQTSELFLVEIQIAEVPTDVDGEDMTDDAPGPTLRSTTRKRRAAIAADTATEAPMEKKGCQ